MQAFEKCKKFKPSLSFTQSSFTIHANVYGQSIPKGKTTSVLLLDICEQMQSFKHNKFGEYVVEDNHDDLNDNL